MTVNNDLTYCQNYFNRERFITRVVEIGNIDFGGENACLNAARGKNIRFRASIQPALTEVDLP